VFAGDTFTVDQRRSIDRAVRQVEADTGLAVCLRIGGVDTDARTTARTLLQRMPDPANAVVLVVDPGARELEIVTGSAARQRLSDADCLAVAESMRTTFVAGDLPGGIMNGVQRLGDAVHRPESLPAG
jgi:hypothetical protein